MIPHRFRPLTTGRADRAARDASIRFLLDLWSDYDADAYTFIGSRWGDHWHDHPIQGDRAAQIREVLANHPASRHDLYFCPNAFSEPHRKAIYALPSRYALCDIDDVDPDSYDPQPNLLWETSPGRFQGIWIWRKKAPAVVAEQYSKNIWAKDGGDKGGWSITKMLRLPGSLNLKPTYKKPVVTLRSYDDQPQRLPSTLKKVRPQISIKLSATVKGHGEDAVAIMRRFRRPMGLQAGSLMTARRMMRPDRSGAVFVIVAAMVEAGASDMDVVTVLLVNPYFLSKWGDDPARAMEQVERIRKRLGGRG